MNTRPDGGVGSPAAISPASGSGTPDFTVEAALDGDLVRLVPASREHAAALHRVAGR